MSGQLHLDVFVPYNPIAGQTARMGQAEATRPAASVLLISGEHDAEVIDADLAPADCGAVVTWVGALTNRQAASVTATRVRARK